MPARLRYAAQKVGGPDELARLAKIARRTLGNYLAGRNEPKPSALARISEVSGLSIGWLVTGRGRLVRDDTANMTPEEVAARDAEEVEVLKGLASGPQVAITPGEQLPDGFVLLPRYDVRISAGGGMIIHSEQIVDFLAFKLEWIRRALGVSPSDLALVSADGDSMRPTIDDRDLLLVHLKESSVRDHAIYALDYGGRLVVKRLQVRRDGGVTIISDNPIYKPEELSRPEAEQLRIVGRVLWSAGVI